MLCAFVNDRRQNLFLNFAQKISKQSEIKKMFLLNNKSQNIGTRKPENFKVQHALTDILKYSALIYVQNLYPAYIIQESTDGLRG